jgi:CRP-like cAMP-binding protein/rhodanese-related sulfurtransferase
MDKKTEIKDILAKSTLFSGLSQEVLESIAGIARELTIPQGTTLGKMGDIGKMCCIIISGRVKLSRPGKSGLEYELGELGPGESFGEFNLLSQEPLPASVKTVEETRLITISKDEFGPILRKYPEVTEAVGKGFSLWLRRAGSVIENQTKSQFESVRLRWNDFIPIVVLSLLFALAFNASNPKGIPVFQKSFAGTNLTQVTPSEIYGKYQNGDLLIIDAKPSIFYEQEHIKNALNLPLSIFDFIYDMKLGKMDKSAEIVVYGRTISKHYDLEVAEKLEVRGFKKVEILRGGLSAWKADHYPVEP